MPRKAHQPTKETRAQVSALVIVGTPHELIGKVIGIAPHTLRKHYRDEIDRAAATANALVVQSLFNMATVGKVPAAAIFWLKSRAGWREVAVGATPPADGGGPAEAAPDDGDGQSSAQRAYLDMLALTAPARRKGKA